MSDSPNKFVEQARAAIQKNTQLKLQTESITAYNKHLSKACFLDIIFPCSSFQVYAI